MLRRWTVLILFACLSIAMTENSASEVLSDIYHNCVSKFSVHCVRSKAIKWISEIADHDNIKLTNELSIIRTSDEDLKDLDERSLYDSSNNVLDKVDRFLSSHALKIEQPRILQDETLRSYIPESYLKGGLANGLIVPLSEEKTVEGRGFVKKVMIPFLLGLKFKSTVLVPLSLALIALKSWKAMTLGLLSLVLAGAMVIFKFAKPKIVNYEIVHFPHHPHHHIPHDHHPIIHDAPHWARNLDSENIAYQGHTK